MILLREPGQHHPRLHVLPVLSDRMAQAAFAMVSAIFPVFGSNNAFVGQPAQQGKCKLKLANQVAAVSMFRLHALLC